LNWFAIGFSGNGNATRQAQFGQRWSGILIASFSFNRPPANSLHELGLGYQRANGKDYVVAKVRLFAEQKGPIYYVAVGESLETPTAKFKRVLSRRFFSMIA